MTEDFTIRNVETVTGETEALLECLKLYAPGVKWTVAMASRFRGSLFKRGYTIEYVVEEDSALTAAPGAEITAHVAPITEALKVKDYYVDDYYNKVFGGPGNEIDWGPDVGREILDAATGAGEEIEAADALLALRNEVLEECACLAETWKSPLRPGNEHRLYGHNEASAEIGQQIRALKHHRPA